MLAHTKDAHSHVTCHILMQSHTTSKTLDMKIGVGQGGSPYAPGKLEIRKEDTPLQHMCVHDGPQVHGWLLSKRKPANPNNTQTHMNMSMHTCKHTCTLIAHALKNNQTETHIVKWTRGWQPPRRKPLLTLKTHKHAHRHYSMHTCKHTYPYN